MQISNLFAKSSNLKQNGFVKRSYEPKYTLNYNLHRTNMAEVRNMLNDAGYIFPCIPIRKLYITILSLDNSDLFEICPTQPFLGIFPIEALNIINLSLMFLR